MTIRVGFKEEVKMPNYTTYNIKMVKGDTESFGFEIEGVENLDAAYFFLQKKFAR